MALSPVRLTIAMTHPVQYYAAWFREIAAHHPAIDLTVVYATRPTPEQQGVGFGRPFEWDVDLLQGYRARVVSPANPDHRMHSDTFFGLDAHALPAAVLETKPNVVLVMGWHAAPLLRVIRACRRHRIPLLFRGDTHLGNAPVGWRRPLWRGKTWLLLRQFDGYLCVGRRVRRYLRRFGVPETRIFTVPHCVDNAFFAESAASHQTGEARRAVRRAFGFDEGDFVVLFAGKFETKKRPLDVIGAASRARVSLLMVGSGPLEAECRAEACALGIRATFTGFLNQSELGRAYAAADCLVLASDWGETWGLVVNEAMATGLPCVVSDRVGCAPDLVVPGRTGEIAPFGDADTLASALCRVREARTVAGVQLADACRTRVDRYSPATAARGLVAACQEVAGRRGRLSTAGASGPSSRVLALCGTMSMVSGLERMTFEVLRVLRARGASVHTIVNNWANWDQPTEPHQIAALAESIGASWSASSYGHALSRRARVGPTLRLLVDNLRTSLHVLVAASRFRPTHVLVPELDTLLRNWPTLLLLRVAGVRIIMRLGNPPAPGAFYRRLWRLAANPVVDRFVCNSRYTTNALRTHGVPASKIDTIYNAPPTRSALPPAHIERDSRRVIYVGQTIPEKGLDLLLDAIGILAARGGDVSLDVVGPIDDWAGPDLAAYRDKLRVRARQPDLADRVRFLGEREGVPDVFAGCAVHCCPSRPGQREGFGVVVVEAKEAGIPSVVLPTGALPELVTHRGDGWICSDLTADALADGLAYFLDDADRLERAGRAARQSLERFSASRFAEAWAAMFSVSAPTSALSADVPCGTVP